MHIWKCLVLYTTLYPIFPGKTAVIRRYTEGHFSPYYKLTIGVDFAVKTLDWDAKTKVTVQLWLV